MINRLLHFGFQQGMNDAWSVSKVLFLRMVFISDSWSFVRFILVRIVYPSESSVHSQYVYGVVLVLIYDIFDMFS